MLGAYTLPCYESGVILLAVSAAPTRTTEKSVDVSAAGIHLLTNGWDPGVFNRLLANGWDPLFIVIPY